MRFMREAQMPRTARVRRVHDRMPVILAPEDYGTWLDPMTPLEQAASPPTSLPGGRDGGRAGRELRQQPEERGTAVPGVVRAPGTRSFRQTHPRSRP